jgi:hypothetical protein
VKIKLFLVLFLLIFGGGSELLYCSNNFGLGIIVGAPTGVSVKYYFNEKNAIDIGIGWSFSKEVVRLHFDYLFHFSNLIKDTIDFPFVLYFGGGVKFLFSNDIKIGFRVPVGLLYNFKKQPIDIFIEVVPVLDLIPDTDFNLDAAIGGRYYFGKK